MNSFGWFAVAFLQDCLLRLHWVGVLFAPALPPWFFGESRTRLALDKH